MALNRSGFAHVASRVSRTSRQRVPTGPAPKRTAVNDGAVSRATTEGLPRRTGRPTLFSEDLADEILAWIAGGRSLNSFCAQTGRPNISTIIRWLDSDPTFAQSYTRARELQADALIDQVLDIADATDGDTYVDPSGKRRTDHEAIHRSRLRVETRFKLAAAMHPRKYGAKLDLGVAEPQKTRAELEEEVATLLKRLGYVRRTV